MIARRFFLQVNSLMFSADRSRHRVALGLVAASLIMTPSMSAIPFATLWAAIVLLLPRRAT
jgi:riboflavin transporter FmnP